MPALVSGRELRGVNRSQSVFEQNLVMDKMSKAKAINIEYDSYLLQKMHMATLNGLNIISK